MLYGAVVVWLLACAVPAMAQRPSAPSQSPPAASPPPCEAFTRNEDQDWVAKQDMTVPGPTGPKQIKAGTIVNDELQDQLDDRCKK